MFHLAGLIQSRHARLHASEDRRPGVNENAAADEDGLSKIGARR
jgi:hypothetical protein